MAEEETPEPAQAAQAAQTLPQMRVLSQYVRDMSFENIAAQKSRGDQVQPQIGVQVNLDANPKGDKQYEVILKLNISAKSGEETVFLLELDYGGRFHIDNIAKEQLHPYLMIECPRMLFPYVRRIVGDVTRDGGYPPLNLDNIDFLNLYRQELLRRQQSENQPN